MEVFIEPTNDLIRLLSMKDSDDQPPDAMTVAQMQEATGLGEKKIRKTLRHLIDKGHIQCVPIYIKAINGTSVRSYGYRANRVADSQ